MNKIFLSVIVILALAFIVAGCTQSASTQSQPSPTPTVDQNPPADQATPTDQSQPPITNPTISYDAQITYRTYGGNMNPQTSVKELTVNGTSATLSTLSSDNVLQSQTSKTIDNAVFTQLVDSMNANNFLELSNVYGGKNPDIGSTDISVMQTDVTKTVTIGTIGDSPPSSLNTIIAMFQSIEDNFTQSTDTMTNSPPSVQLMVSNNNILVDGNGMTLYTFDQDTNGRSACYNTCASFWPPVYVSVDSPAAGTVPGTIGIVQRTDGKYQATYDGQPLYYYLQDKNPGDMNGNNLNVSGGVWYVVNATS